MPRSGTSNYRKRHAWGPVKIGRGRKLRQRTCHFRPASGGWSNLTVASLIAGYRDLLKLQPAKNAPSRVELAKASAMWHVQVFDYLAGDNFTVAASLTQSSGKKLFLYLTRQFKNSHLGSLQVALKSHPPISHPYRLHQIASPKLRSLRAVWPGSVHGRLLF